MKNKISLLLILLLGIGCKSYNKDLFPRLNKEDSKIVIDFFKYVHKGKDFDIKNLKKIEEIQKNPYFVKNILGFKKTRYLPKTKNILYLSKKDYKNLYLKDISTGKSRILRNFQDEVYRFDINSKGDEIVLDLRFKLEVYSFPSLKFIAQIPGSHSRFSTFDIGTDKIYYKNDCNLNSWLNGKKQVLFTDNHKQAGGINYRILPNKDIYIKLYRYNHGQRNRWYLPSLLNAMIYGKGWWEHYLLSNPRQEIAPPPPILSTKETSKDYLW